MKGATHAAQQGPFRLALRESNKATCGFCNRSALIEADLIIENDFCLYSISHDLDTDLDVLPRSGLIVPLAHRATAFDLTTAEWAAAQDLLLKAKAELDERFAA